MRLSRIIVTVAVALVLSVALSACSHGPSSAPAPGSPATPQAKPELKPASDSWPKTLKIGSSAPGGYWFTIAAALSEIINQELKGVTATPTSGGQVTNVKNCNSGDYQIALGCNYTEYDAFVGREPFESKMTNVRSIGNLYPSQWHIITAKSANINSVPDLKGHPFSPGTKGMGGEVIAQRVLQEYGMSYNDLGKMNLTSYDDAALLMKDKHIHAMFIQMLAPSAPFVDVGTFMPIRVISVGADKMDAICQKYKMFPGVIPKGTYPGQEEDVVCPCGTNEVIVNKNLPEDMVYEITKAMWKNADKIRKVSTGLAPYVKIEDALKGLGLPLHKGAYKYYVEAGIKVPDELKPID
ncbi:MAG: TAXI family TRAP transporter solute-binding subunit [Ignavibacteriales bacterium]